MKVKLIAASFIKEFENQTNDFINQKDIKVLELQYSASYGNYTVMIVYEEAETKYHLVK